MTTLCIISFATLAFSCVACAVLGLGILAAVWGRKLSKELEHDRKHGYQLPPEAMPQSRPCPPWVNRSNGRAKR